MTRLRANRTSSASGQSVVELAIILPVLLLITLGTIDMGRAFFTWVTLRNAASEAALWGARNLTASEGDIQDRALNVYLPAAYRTNPPTSASPQRDPACSTPNGEGKVTVSMSRQFSPISLDVLDLVAPGGDWAFTINPSAQARCLT
jgi:Flp pilus assembly protein TadG